MEKFMMSEKSDWLFRGLKTRKDRSENKLPVWGEDIRNKPVEVY